MALRNDGTLEDHGGNLLAAQARYPKAQQPWIDLSTGINPHSYPLFDLPATALTRLPEPGRTAELRAIAAGAYGAPSPENLVAAPGTQILLPLVAQLLRPGRARVLSPTYAEHARAAALAGHRVEEVGEPQALSEADLAILVNPNNPDGRIVEHDRLLEIAAGIRSRGGLLVVDEAFMDVGPQGVSLAGDIEQQNLVVLRSFGKFYGLAGLRLGFAITSKEIAGRLAAELGPWAVAGPSLEYGLRALADDGWRGTMRDKLVKKAAQLDDSLASGGLKLVGGTSLFRLAQHPQAHLLFEWLAERGILVRRFGQWPEWLRFGLPADDGAFARLNETLSSWRSANPEIKNQELAVR